MAVVTITNSNNRRNAADATTGWSSEGGGGAGPQDEPDFFYQGTQAVSRKMGTTAGGFKFSDGTPVDMTAAADSVALLKGIWTNKDVLIAQPSAQFWIGSSTANYIEYHMADDGTRGDINYPKKGGWLIAMINPNVTAWRDEIVGTPNLTIIDEWVIQSDFSTSSKGENVAMDAIDIGPGLYLVGGDSTDPDGVWDDFVSHDEGTIGNSFGYISTIGSVTFLCGVFTIGENATGTDTATVFQDQDKTVVFPATRADSGDNAIELELNNATTDIDFIRHTLIGEGRDNQKHFFDTDNEVTAATDIVTITNGHEFQTGDAVLYSNEGGTETPGPTNATEYFVNRISSTTLSLHTNRANAFSDTTRVALTESTAGNGESHSLTRQPDTRPQVTSRGTLGTVDISASSMQRMGLITMTTGFTISNTAISGSLGILMTSGQGVIDTLTVNSPLNEPGEAFISTTETDNITDSTFNLVATGGHALDITATTNTPFTLDGNIIVGQGASIEATLPTDLDDVNDEIDSTAHGFATGEEVYYNDRGNTSITGLTDGARYYVRAVTANAISFHATEFDAENNLNKIAISGGGAGTHEFASGHAGLFNSSGGAITVNVSGGGTTPTVRNSVGSTTVVNNNINVTVTVKDEAGVAIQSAQVSVRRDDNNVEVLGGTTNASGQVTGTAEASIGGVNVRVRKGSGGGTDYFPVRSPQTIGAVDVEFTIAMIEDTINAN